MLAGPAAPVSRFTNSGLIPGRERPAGGAARRGAACFALLSCQSAIELEGGRVHPDVMTALRAEGQASVMIALADPVAVDPAAGDQDAAEIGRMQDSVLSVVDTTEFRLRVRYTAVPALAGTVMSAAALRALARIVM
jgi:hypothetical protein